MPHATHTAQTVVTIANTNWAIDSGLSLIHI